MFTGGYTGRRLLRSLPQGYWLDCEFTTVVMKDLGSSSVISSGKDKAVAERASRGTFICQNWGLISACNSLTDWQACSIVNFIENCECFMEESALLFMVKRTVNIKGSFEVN